MHSHISLPCEAGLQPASIAERLGRRTGAFAAPFWPARHWHRRWVGPAADPLSPGRAPEESYRDYMFRKTIWP